MRRTKQRQRRAVPWAVAACTLYGGTLVPAQAAEMTYFYGYRVEHSDNIRRVATNQENEVIHSLLAGVTYQDRSPALDLRLAPAVELLKYQDNTFDDETRLTLDAVALWTIAPQRFTWTFEDNARQVRIDPTAPDTPANTALANYLNTGPDFYLRFNPVNTLQLGARYANVHIADTNLDSERGQAYGRWLYQSSPRTTLSLNVEAQKVEFDDEFANPNYKRNDIFVRAQTRPAQSTFILDAGKTTIDRDGFAEVDGSLTRFTWLRQLSTETSLGVLAESGFSDTGTDLAETAAANNNPVEETPRTVSQNLVTQDIFRAKRAEIFFDRASSLFTTNLRVFGRDFEFQASPLDDRKEHGGSVAVAYLYSAATTLGVFGNILKADYRNQILTDTDTTVGVSFLRRITRTVSVTLQLQREERDSTTLGREFVEDRVLLTLLYNSGTIMRGR